MNIIDQQKALRYLPSLNLKVGGSRLDDFFERASDWVASRITGDRIAEAVPASADAKLRRLAERLAAVKGYRTAVAEMDLQLSEAGFVVQSNEAMSPASKERTASLCRSLDLRIMEDADSLTSHLWKNSVNGKPYGQWRETPRFERLSSAFTPYSFICNVYLQGQQRLETWDSFFALIPRLVEALETAVAPYVSPEQVELLRRQYRTEQLSEAQQAVMRRLVRAEMAAVKGDAAQARAASIEARSLMMQRLAEFPAFAASDCFQLPAMRFNEGHIVDTL